MLIVLKVAEYWQWKSNGRQNVGRWRNNSTTVKFYTRRWRWS